MLKKSDDLTIDEDRLDGGIADHRITVGDEY
jgi:hypothetical protein